MKYIVTMYIQGYYKKEVEAESEEEAKDIAWNCGDFGDLHDIDGDFVSCEIDGE